MASNLKTNSQDWIILTKTLNSCRSYPYWTNDQLLALFRLSREEFERMTVALRHEVRKAKVPDHFSSGGDNFRYQTSDEERGQAVAQLILKHPKITSGFRWGDEKPRDFMELREFALKSFASRKAMIHRNPGRRARDRYPIIHHSNVEQPEYIMISEDDEDEEQGREPMQQSPLQQFDCEEHQGQKPIQEQSATEEQMSDNDDQSGLRDGENFRSSRLEETVHESNPSEKTRQQSSPEISIRGSVSRDSQHTVCPVSSSLQQTEITLNSPRPINISTPKQHGSALDISNASVAPSAPAPSTAHIAQIPGSAGNVPSSSAPQHSSIHLAGSDVTTGPISQNSIRRDSSEAAIDSRQSVESTRSYQSSIRQENITASVSCSSPQGQPQPQVQRQPQVQPHSQVRPQPQPLLQSQSQWQQQPCLQTRPHMHHGQNAVDTVAAANPQMQLSRPQTTQIPSVVVSNPLFINTVFRLHYIQYNQMDRALSPAELLPRDSDKNWMTMTLADISFARAKEHLTIWASEQARFDFGDGEGLYFFWVTKNGITRVENDLQLQFSVINQLRLPEHDINLYVIPKDIYHSLNSSSRGQR